ncbi:MAG: hypothetical protein JO025_12925 [Verrucomicrobia bacterium]|nr:hypothetical protein [Verrucomicrobiota bacterium]
MDTPTQLDPMDIFYDYYGEYFSGRDVRLNALQTLAQIHFCAGNPKPPDRMKSIEALFELLGSGGTGANRADAANIYDKLREDAGLYRLE